MKIFVTSKDIKHGEPQETNYCPVALAIARKLDIPNFTVYVSQSSVEIEGTKVSEYKIICFPKKVRNFIKRFDKGKEVKPFNFNLKI